MGQNAWESYDTQPFMWHHLIRLTGGSGLITKNHGKSVTINYISTGIFDVVWSESPTGQYFGFAHGFDATTVADLKGYTLVGGQPTTSAPFTQRFNITNASDTLADLTSTQHLYLDIAFRMTNA